MPTELLRPTAEGFQANGTTLSITAPPALRGGLAVDNVRLVEWRPRTETVEADWVDADLVRAAEGRSVDLIVSGC